jgi:hypothetical protein
MNPSKVPVQAISSGRLPLAVNVAIDALLTGAASKLPPINLFRALANAPSLRQISGIISLISSSRWNSTHALSD